MHAHGFEDRPFPGLHRQGHQGRRVDLGEHAGAAAGQLLNLENAVGRSSKQRKANTGADFKPIPGAAPQFQTGGLALSEMLNCDNALVNFYTVNCGIQD